MEPLTPPPNSSGNEEQCDACGTVYELNPADPVKTPCPTCFPEGQNFDHLETLEKPCADCRENFTTSVVRLGSRVLDFVRFCEPCSLRQQRTEKSRKQEAFIAARKAAWEEICPPFYRTEEIAAALPQEKFNAVRAGIAKGGVLIYGPSGTFKTTAMFHGAVKKLVWAGEKVLFTSAMEWKPKCSAAAKDCQTEAFLKPYVKAPWLFLDDLGNMGGTDASEEALHSLFEQRMRAKLPLLATTQYQGEALAGRFKTPQIGTAIVRRIFLLTSTQLSYKSPT